MKTMGKALSIILMFWLLLSALKITTVANGQQVESTCKTKERFAYNCEYSFEEGMIERLTEHEIEIEVWNLGTGLHELEFVLSTEEQLLSIQPFIGNIGNPTNSSSDEKLFIKFQTEEDYVSFRMRFNSSSQSFDPIDIATLPLGIPNHPMTTKGELKFDFWINNTEYLDSCMFTFGQNSNINFQQLSLLESDLKYQEAEYFFHAQSFLMNNVSKGLGHIGFNAFTNNLGGYIPIQVKATEGNQHTKIECCLNGFTLPSEGSVSSYYNLNNFQFALQLEPYYYYGRDMTYLLNFTLFDSLILRIDSSTREEIRSLQFESLPSNFSVQKTSYRDEPCYEFSFQTEKSSNCFFSVNLKSKEWIISPENLTLEDIPRGVTEKFLNPSSSTDGSHFNIDDEYVQQWAKELTTDLTNPYVIASTIYENLTKTIKVPPDWRESNENDTFEEDVKGTLELKRGVCRHIARAYVALCICSGLPSRTVIGTAFTSAEDIWKKNHEWAEIYIPGYSWVPVDATWNQTFQLDQQHAKITYWRPYLNESLVMSRINSTVEKEMISDSKATITHLIELCKEYTKDNIEAEVLLDKASFNLEQESIHESLLCIAEAYTLAADDTAESKNGYSGFIIFGVIFITSLATSIILIVIQRLSKKQKANKQK